MNEFDRLAAENQRMKALMQAQGFKFTYDPKTGGIKDIKAPSKPRKPQPKHTAVTWMRKRGFKMNASLIRTITKNQVIGYRKFKNASERAALIQEAREYLASNKFNVSLKYFNKVPLYVLKNNDFYENVNAILNSMNKNYDQFELTNETIKYSMDASIDRIKRANGMKQETDNKIRSGLRARNASLADLQNTGLKATPKKKDKVIKNALKAVRK